MTNTDANELIPRDSEFISGTTATPIVLQTPVVDTRKVSTSTIQMNGTSVDGITSNHNDNDPRKLITSFAMQQMRSELAQGLENLNDILYNTVFSPVLSDPVTSPYFTDSSKWLMYAWRIDNGRVVFENKTPDTQPQGSLRLLPDAFPTRGTYYIYLTVEEITGGGKLVLTDYHGTTLTEIINPKTVQLEFEVDYPGTFWISLDAMDFPENHRAVVTCFSVHFVKPEFISYMNYVAMKVASGGSSWVTSDELDSIVNALKSNLTNYIDSVINTGLADIRMHVNDTSSNPHQITIDMINAADVAHTHDFTQFSGIADRVLTPISNLQASLADVYQQIAEVDDNLAKHQVAQNPHAITCDMIGAARDDHNHAINDVAGLDAKLTELSDSLNGISVNLNETVEQLTSSLDQRLTAHEHGVNPHGITAELIGVQFATEAEAADVTNETGYMNPKLTNMLVQSLLPDKNFEVSFALPKQFAVITLSDSEPVVELAINPTALYEIVIQNFTSGLSFKDITISPEGFSGTGNTYITKDAQMSGLYELSDTVMHFVSSDDIQDINGRWTYDPVNNTLCGMCTGRNSSTITVGKCGCAPMVKPNKQISKLTFTRVGNTGKSIELLIYEQVSASEYPLITDVSPIGSIIERIGSIAPVGYSLMDGSWLVFESVPELYEYVEQNKLLIDEAAYQSQINLSGFCQSFTKNTTMLRLPTLDNSGIVKKYMKIRPCIY